MNKHLGVIGPVAINLLIEPRDLWIGVFRGKSYIEMGQLFSRYYIFPIPVFGILLTIERPLRRENDE